MVSEKRIDVVFRFRDQFTAGFKKSIDTLTSGTRAAQRSWKSIETGGKKLTSFGTAMSKHVTAPLVAAGVASTKAFEDFNTALAKVSTIADTGQESMADLQKEILKTSDATGVAAADVAEQTYQAISAGQSTDKAVSAVQRAINLSKAGFTDVGSAMDVLTTVTNAYGKSAGSLEHISDVLIKTQNLGKVTVDELASSMGKVIPTAASYGVGLEDLSSGYVELTKNGISARNATTYLNSMYNELGKSGTGASKLLKEATGKTFSELTASGLSTRRVLNILGQAAEKSGKKMTDVFGNVNSAKAANTLIAHAKDYKSALDGVRKSAGTTETALGKLGKTDQAKLTKSINRLKNDLIKLGADVAPILIPILEKGLKVIDDMAGRFQALPKSTRESIISFLGVAAAIGPVLTFGGRFVTTFGHVGGSINKTIGAIKALKKGTEGLSTLGAVGKWIVGGITSPAGMAIAAMLGIAAVTALVITHWQTFKKIGQATFGPLFRTIQEAIGGITDIFRGLLKFISGVFTGNWSKAWAGVKQIFGGVFQAFPALVKAPFNAVIGIINGAITGINAIHIPNKKWIPAKFRGAGFDIPTIPLLAKGTTDWSGGPAVINEAGGEIVDLPSGSRVIPHDLSKQAVAPRNLSVTISKLADRIEVRDDSDIDKIADRIVTKLEQMQDDFVGEGA